MKPPYKLFFTIICSALGAGFSYSLWMVAFILATPLHNVTVELILWLLAPPVTAAGFTAGVAAFEHLVKDPRSKFIRIFLWPLTGCTVGAAAVYWYGPMLIVFGMFAAGTISVACRHLMRSRRSG